MSRTYSRHGGWDMQLNGKKYWKGGKYWPGGQKNRCFPGVFRGKGIGKLQK